MFLKLHKYIGIIAGVIIVIMAVSGAVLSVYPALDKLSTVGNDAGISVAHVASKIQQKYPSVEQIKRLPSGKVIVYFFKNERLVSEQVDPITVNKIANYQVVGFRRWMTNLHRSLFLDDTGRYMAALAALSMLILSISGAKLVASRNGGWAKFFAPVKGNRSQKLHIELARFALFGLLLSSTTAIYMFLTTFGYVLDGMSQVAQFPQIVAYGIKINLADAEALKQINLSQLRELIFPYPDDPADVFSITTQDGAGFIDPVTGQMLDYLPHNIARQIYEFIYMLHTGQGLWWLGLILGISTAVIPILSVTGWLLWWRNHNNRPKISNISPAQIADKIILVGSQGSSSRVFAAALHKGLVKQGFKVHIEDMNKLKKGYKNADSMFILTSTYADGEAPKSADKFLQKLSEVKGVANFKVSVLGFGDKQFPQYCQFAIEVEHALNVKEWQQIMPLKLINQQSAQAFDQWGQAVGKALDISLVMDYMPRPRVLQTLKLISRQDYGQTVQAPTSIFRFAPADTIGRSLFAKLFKPQLPNFEAGDLVGIVPNDCDIPRFYSLASAKKDGFLEICVRKQAGGLCSGQLHGLNIGDEIKVFIQQNSKFRPALGNNPVILIGAGAGIAPLSGFLRQNKKQQPMYLYFGCRDPKSDFLYETEINNWIKANRLKTCHIAFSRIGNKAYVQDRLTDDVENLRNLMKQGAQIMICGSKKMANDVEATLKTIFEPMGIKIDNLRKAGRYLEDVY